MEDDEEDASSNQDTSPNLAAPEPPRRKGLGKDGERKLQKASVKPERRKYEGALRKATESNYSDTLLIDLSQYFSLSVFLHTESLGELSSLRK